MVVYASVRRIDGAGGIMFSGCPSVCAYVHVQAEAFFHRIEVDFCCCLILRNYFLHICKVNCVYSVSQKNYTTNSLRFLEFFLAAANFLLTFCVPTVRSYLY